MSPLGDWDAVFFMGAKKGWIRDEMNCDAME